MDDVMKKREIGSEVYVKGAWPSGACAETVRNVYTKGFYLGGKIRI